MAMRYGPACPRNRRAIPFLTADPFPRYYHEFGSQLIYLPMAPAHSANVRFSLEML